MGRTADATEKLNRLLGKPTSLDTMKAALVLNWLLDGNIKDIGKNDPNLWYLRQGVIRLVERGYRARQDDGKKE